MRKFQTLIAIATVVAFATSCKKKETHSANPGLTPRDTIAALTGTRWMLAGYGGDKNGNGLLENGEWDATDPEIFNFRTNGTVRDSFNNNGIPSEFNGLWHADSLYKSVIYYSRFGSSYFWKMSIHNITDTSLYILEQHTFEVRWWVFKKYRF